MVNRISFWQALNQEVRASKIDDCLPVIQLDANAKLGKNFLREDPNDISENGRLLLGLVERENLMVLNASDQCTGGITRHRQTKDATENSILDYVIVCDKMAEYFHSMLIDDRRVFQ